VCAGAHDHRVARFEASPFGARRFVRSIYLSNRSHNT
jgi:hypothetical protein